MLSPPDPPSPASIAPDLPGEGKHAPEWIDAVTVTFEAAGLAAIARSAAALAVWERTLDPDLAAALAALRLEALDDLGATLDPGAAGTRLVPLLRQAGYPARAAALLAADAADLARRHGALLGVRRLAMRLEVVETDACRRFHADYVTLRMICTYCGPGTQWRLGANDGAVEQVPTGAVAVFKGRTLLDPPVVLHRSPPILATGGRRLMLVLDPIDDAAATPGGRLDPG